MKANITDKPGVNTMIKARKIWCHYFYMYELVTGEFLVASPSKAQSGDGRWRCCKSRDEALKAAYVSNADAHKALVDKGEVEIENWFAERIRNSDNGYQPTNPEIADAVKTFG